MVLPRRHREAPVRGTLNKSCFVIASGLRPRAQRGGKQSGLPVKSERSGSPRPCWARDDVLDQLFPGSARTAAPGAGLRVAAAGCRRPGLHWSIRARLLVFTNNSGGMIMKRFACLLLSAAVTTSVAACASAPVETDAAGQRSRAEKAQQELGSDVSRQKPASD